MAHVNLFVSNLEASTEFYSDICGLEVVFEEPGIEAVFLSNGNSHHDLALMQASGEQRVGRDGHVQVPTGRGRHAGLNHLGFEMETEAQLVAAIARADGEGFRLHRVVDHQISHSAYLFDPEGNYLEMYADATDDWREVYRDSEGQLITGEWDPFASPPSDVPLYDQAPDFAAVPHAAVRPIRAARAMFAVDNVDRCSDFYTNVIGLEGEENPHGDGVLLRGRLGLADLQLSPLSSANPPGLARFSLEVAEPTDLESGAERMEKEGLTARRSSSLSGEESITVMDPDGITVEFFAPSTPQAS